MKPHEVITALLSALVIGCTYSSHGIPGPRVVAEDPSLARQFKELTGMDATDRIYHDVYRKSRSEGVFSHRHIGSHGCFVEFIVRTDEHLDVIGTRTDTTGSRAVLLMIGYDERQCDQAMAAIASAMQWPCGGPRF